MAEGKYFLIDVNVSTSRITSKVSILIDSNEGISIDECADISRRLGHQLEELNWFANPYNLEISSPGVDTPLTFDRQYNKNIGRELRIVKLDGTETKGILKAVTATGIALEEATKKKVKWQKPGQEPTEEPNSPAESWLEMPFSQILKAQVLISFK